MIFRDGRSFNSGWLLWLHMQHTLSSSSSLSVVFKPTLLAALMFALVTPLVPGSCLDPMMHVRFSGKASGATDNFPFLDFTVFWLKLPESVMHWWEKLVICNSFATFWQEEPTWRCGRCISFRPLRSFCGLLNFYTFFLLNKYLFYFKQGPSFFSGASSSAFILFLEVSLVPPLDPRENTCFSESTLKIWGAQGFVKALSNQEWQIITCNDVVNVIWNVLVTKAAEVFLNGLKIPTSRGCKIWLYCQYKDADTCKAGFS